MNDHAGALGTIANVVGLAVDLPSLLHGLGSIRWSRAEVTLQEVVEATNMPAADLARLASENEQLGDLLATGLELGARTRLERKRRALGAIVGHAFMHPTDSATIDDCELLLRAIEPLDPVHVRIHAGHRGDRDFVKDFEILRSELDEVLQPSATRDAVLATLESAGLIKGGALMEKTRRDVGPGPQSVYGLTRFGVRMLQFLILEDGEPLPNG